MFRFIRDLLTKARRRRALSFQAKYRHFKALLEANSGVLEGLAEIGDRLSAPTHFSIGDVRRWTTAVFVETFKLIRHTQAISPDDGRKLATRLAALREQAEQILASPGGAPDVPYVLPLDQLDRNHAPLVGNKLAVLGELHNRLGVPVPPAFAVTARFARELLAQGRLQDEINKALLDLGEGNPAAVEQVSQAVQSMVVGVPPPGSVEEEVLGAYDRLCEQTGGVPKLAVRSSAIGEDEPRCSFAGLYYTALNVRRESLIDACYEVLVSKFLPRSIMYLRLNGLRREDMPMCIGCMAMIDPRVSGVVFTEDPAADQGSSRMIVHCVVGLGAGLVDGRVSPERYVVSRDPPGRTLSFDPGGQRTILRPAPKEGVMETPVPAAPNRTPSLSDRELTQLASYALDIERHFGGPQDIEWAMDHDGQLWILQARPLVISCPLPSAPLPEPVVGLEDRYTTLAASGECASPGVGTGRVVVVRSVRALRAFPDKGVLVASRGMPELTEVLHKASAVVTESGGTTAHLAIMAREYGVPCLMNVPGATELPPGEEVTVDAFSGRIYAGRVRELESERYRRPMSHPLTGTPVHQALAQIAELSLALNLTDPNDRSFRAAECKTIHDISRFCHETAIQRMFTLSDEERGGDGQVHRLKFPVPLSVYVIDVGQGLVDGSPSGAITPEHVASTPFKALIRGMTAEGLAWSGARPVDLRGFMSVLASTASDPHGARRGLGDCSYAIVSQDYLNFTSRLGYHFSTLDAHVSEATQGNYIGFTFEGGAADVTRRERRAVFIGRVLERFGFWVDQKGDLVKASARRVERDVALRQLDMCGRLMGAARQVDASMRTDALIDRCVERFMAGDYTLGLTEPAR